MWFLINTDDKTGRYNDSPVLILSSFSFKRYICTLWKFYTLNSLIYAKYFCICYNVFKYNNILISYFYVLPPHLNVLINLYYNYVLYSF